MLIYLHSFDQKYSNFMKYYNLTKIFEYILYKCDGKAELSAAVTPDFSVTRSFRNQSNMLICCLMLMMHEATFWAVLPGNFSWAMLFGHFPIKNG